ncbi:MAG: hypothetical protein KGL13_05685, partial [Gammaproteobacteria bacterium]|nr:hypothetical protein [Gammaproteobacteria bacterium]
SIHISYFILLFNLAGKGIAITGQNSGNPRTLDFFSDELGEITHAGVWGMESKGTVAYRPDADIVEQDLRRRRKHTNKTHKPCE